MILGLDISTSCIGVCVMDMEGKLIELTHIDFKDSAPEFKKEKRYIGKAEAFRNFMEQLKAKYDAMSDSLKGDYYRIKQIWVEMPLANALNRNTVNTLIEFNGICRYILYRTFEVEPEVVSEHDARALFLPEFCRLDTVMHENPAVYEFIQKNGIEFRPETKTFKAKVAFIKRKYPTADLQFYIPTLKRVFSYPKSVDIKSYIFDKVCSLEKDFSPIEKKSKRKVSVKLQNAIDKKNFDMSDAYVIAIYGVAINKTDESQDKDN